MKNKISENQEVKKLSKNKFQLPNHLDLYDLIEYLNFFQALYAIENEYVIDLDEEIFNNFSYNTLKLIKFKNIKVLEDKVKILYNFYVSKEIIDKLHNNLNFNRLLIFIYKSISLFDNFENIHLDIFENEKVMILFKYKESKSYKFIFENVKMLYKNFNEVFDTINYTFIGDNQEITYTLREFRNVIFADISLYDNEENCEILDMRNVALLEFNPILNYCYSE